MVSIGMRSSARGMQGQDLGNQRWQLRRTQKSYLLQVQRGTFFDEKEDSSNGLGEFSENTM